MRNPFGNDADGAGARRIGLSAAVIGGNLGLLLLLSGATFGLSTKAAGAVSTLSVWSTVILIVGNRTWNGRLSLRDYADLYRMADLTFLSFGSNVLAIVMSTLPERAWFGLMLLSFLPCLAIGTIVRRVLFSPEEWTAATATRDESITTPA